ncbi:MAG: serine--tRNA ligase [Anaerolineae bacterium]|nr:serine--tRNA ligase [Anaerolineae bacterium]
MLDINLIRERPDYVKGELKKLNTEAPIDEILELDERRRALVAQVDELRSQRNSLSREIGRTRDQEARQPLVERVRGINAEIELHESELSQTEERLHRLMLEVPNMPDESVPVGKDESENVVVRTWGKPRQFDFEPKPHWELGLQLGIIDFERGVKISGTRFYVLVGAGARLQRALISWMLDLHVRRHGYTEVYPPYLVRGDCLVGTGQLPKFGENLYKDHEEDLWMIPTAEVPVTNLYRDEILEPGRLPIHLVAYSACFRREKMSAGRETRGLKRGHQFDKVEMVKFCAPEESAAELDSLIRNAEEVAELLEIPYRIIQMCTGDLSFTAAAKFDVEMWAPGSQEWLEVSSCSNFKDFQARRAGIRYRPEEGARPQFVHTLNGSGLALPRTVIAVMENYQQADGSIVVPEVLRPFMGGQEIITGP